MKPINSLAAAWYHHIRPKIDVFINRPNGVLLVCKQCNAEIPLDILPDETAINPSLQYAIEEHKCQ